MDEVEMLCDQIGILRDGMFVFEGTVKEAVDNSLTVTWRMRICGGHRRKKQMKRFIPY